MDGRTLSSKLNYTGMERAVRKLAVDEKLATAEEIAVMSELDVCNLVVQEFEMVYSESEELGLVRHDDMPEYNRIIKVISR